MGSTLGLASMTHIMFETNKADRVNGKLGTTFGRRPATLPAKPGGLPPEDIIHHSTLATCLPLHGDLVPLPGQAAPPTRL